MKHSTTTDLGPGLGRLFTEIEAYLAVVDAMRREGIEPRWALEPQTRSRERLVNAPTDVSLRRAVWE